MIHRRNNSEQSTVSIRFRDNITFFLQVVISTRGRKYDENVRRSFVFVTGNNYTKRCMFVVFFFFCILFLSSSLFSKIKGECYFIFQSFIKVSRASRIFLWTYF